MIDPVFTRFTRRPPQDDGTFDIDFMGTRTRKEIDPSNPLQAGLSLSGRSGYDRRDPTLPMVPSEDYYEWRDLLAAIAASGEVFRMIELGAGYGRWCANAVGAIRNLVGRPRPAFHVTAVETKTSNCADMARHFADNAIEPSCYAIVNAAVVGDSAKGRDTFVLLDSLGGWEGLKFGAGIDAREQLAAMFPKGQDVATFIARRPDGSIQAQQTYQRCATATLAEIGGGHVIDFLDIDVQGAEGDIVAESIDYLCAHVRHMHIGTHGAEIERRILPILINSGWRIRNFFSFSSSYSVPEGDFSTSDGIISCTNPRLVPQEEPPAPPARPVY